MIVVAPSHRTSSICCEGHLSPREGNDACCRTQPYSQNVSICCHGDGRLSPKGGEYDGCCDTQLYSETDSICCAGLLSPRRGDDACCGPEAYSQTDSICCDHRFVNPRAGNDACCGRRAFNTTSQICCHHRSGLVVNMGHLCPKYLQGENCFSLIFRFL